MIKPIFNFKHTIAVFAFFGSLLFPSLAHTQTDNRIPLVARVMELMPQIPPDAFPPEPDRQFRLVRPGLFAHSRPVFEVPSKDGTMAAGTEDGDLYIRLVSGGENKVVANKSSEWNWDVEGALWSPDGRAIAVRMRNDSEVPQIPIVSYQEKNEITSMKAYSRAGAALPKDRVYFVDTKTGASVQIKQSGSDPYFHLLEWNSASDTLYFLRADRLTQRLDLLSANAKSGDTKLIHTETGKSGALWWNMLQGYDGHMASQKLVTMLSDGRFLWTSEESGFAHIYLHDGDGRRLRSLTEGKVAGYVELVIDIDEDSGFIYTVMQGIDDDNPYDQALYRFSLADGKPQKLADGPTIMLAFLSEDKKNVVVHRSGFPNTFKVESVQTDGTGHKIIWSAELSFLKDFGFAPEIVTSLASDGKSKLRSLILKPKNLDPENPYPVLEWIYGGPNTTVFVNDLTDPQQLELQDLANEGFIIVLTDGRGTPGRGREFRDFAKGRFGQVEIADHAAVLRELGKTRKYMDMSRVGIFGHSWGGYFTLRALLEEPELYKAGVMLAPVANASSMRVAVEPFMGCLSADCPDAYKAGDSLSEIAKLSAPLLIIHGTADDDIPISESVKLVDALQKARKEHEFVLLAGTDHIVQRSPVTFSKTLGFFKTHLSERP